MNFLVFNLGNKQVSTFSTSPPHFSITHLIHSNLTSPPNHSTKVSTKPKYPLHHTPAKPIHQPLQGNHPPTQALKQGTPPAAIQEAFHSNWPADSLSVRGCSDQGGWEERGILLERGREEYWQRQEGERTRERIMEEVGWGKEYYLNEEQYWREEYFLGRNTLEGRKKYYKCLNLLSLAAKRDMLASYCESSKRELVCIYG